MNRCVLSCFMVALICTPVLGQDWAAKMFPVKKHNFGTVARGAEAKFVFPFKNIFGETIHVAELRVSCGCTTAKIANATIGSLETSEIVAIYNTRSFIGKRGATITVVIDEPQYAEVQLRVDGYIRSDVVFDPGEINFGTVEAGGSIERVISINYAGRADWKLVDVRSAHEHIEVGLSQPVRQQGQVQYEMTVRLLPSAPIGFFRDQLVLVSDDQAKDEVVLAMSGQVSSPLKATSDLVLGSVATGQEVTRNLVVRSKQSFKIVALSCNDKRFELAADSASKKIHVIPVTFKANEETGEFNCPILIKTDLAAGLDCKCIATGSVIIRR